LYFIVSILFIEAGIFILFAIMVNYNVTTGFNPLHRGGDIHTSRLGSRVVSAFKFQSSS